jgi:hypothetical protein
MKRRHLRWRLRRPARPSREVACSPWGTFDLRLCDRLNCFPFVSHLLHDSMPAEWTVYFRRLARQTNFSLPQCPSIRNWPLVQLILPHTNGQHSRLNHAMCSVCVGTNAERSHSSSVTQDGLNHGLTVLNSAVRRITKIKNVCS